MGTTVVTVEVGDPTGFAVATWAVVLVLCAYRLSQARDGYLPDEPEELYSFWQIARSHVRVALTLVIGVTILLTIANLSPASFGWTPLSPTVVGFGIGLGVVLKALDALLGVLGPRVGLEVDSRAERLHESMVPKRPRQWLGQIVVVFPLVAVGEEMLFRGGLIWGSVVGLGLSPLVAVVLSSLAFGVYHLWQGAAGVLSTTLMGVGFGLGYVLTGTLLVPVLAHYVANELTMAVVAGFGPELESPAI